MVTIQKIIIHKKKGIVNIKVFLLVKNEFNKEVLRVKVFEADNLKDCWQFAIKLRDEIGYCNDEGRRMLGILEETVTVWNERGK